MLFFARQNGYINGYIIEPNMSFCWSVGMSGCWSFCHNLLKRREVSLPCFYRRLFDIGAGEWVSEGVLESGKVTYMQKNFLSKKGDSYTSIIFILDSNIFVFNT